MNVRMILVTTTLSLAGSSAVFGQSANSSRFEVASIKRNTTSDPRTRQLVPQPGGRLVGVNAPVRLLIENAYQVRPFQIIGGPDWINSEGYDVEARAEAGSTVTPQQTLKMLQALLEERFNLKVHHEARELPIFVLQVAKNGPKLQAAKEGSCFTADPNTPGVLPPPPPPGQQPHPRCGSAGISISPQGTRLFGGQIAVAELARVLSVAVGRPVIDKTGFTGTFDADLAFLPDQATPGLPNPGPGLLPPPDPTAVTIFTALQEQLGLKLDSAKGPVDVLIIDSVQRPSEN